MNLCQFRGKPDAKWGLTALPVTSGMRCFPIQNRTGFFSSLEVAQDSLTQVIENLNFLAG
jgi:hypothetical protein